MSTYDELVEKTVYITIATVDENGQPWNTPVFSAYDEAGNFYWGSHMESQHSKNILKNQKVFLVIYDSTAPAGTGEGAYVQATARILESEEEVRRAHALLQNRRPVPYWKLEEVSGTSPVRLFQATPTKRWLNDGGELNGVYIDVRTEVQI